MSEVLKYLDFVHYKEFGKIAYVEYKKEKTKQEPIPDTHVDDLASIMDLSTDEIVAEITCILEAGIGLRKLPLKTLSIELTSRLKIIEAICLLANVSEGGD